MNAHERSLTADQPTARPLGPDSETNEMQGRSISFCGHCGGDLDPQEIRRGHPKRFCSDACRARAWRRRVLAGEGVDMNADDPSVAREVIGGGL